MEANEQDEPEVNLNTGGKHLKKTEMVATETFDLHRARQFSFPVHRHHQCHRSLTNNEEEEETSSSEAVKYPTKISETRMVYLCP